MNKADFKQQLMSIKDKEFQPPNTSAAADLLPLFLEHIGDPDGELRDELIFEVFGEWIYSGIYTPQEVIQITETLVSNEYILYDLGNPEGDGLFKRAFCVLQLFVILYAHREKNILPETIVTRIADQILILITQEKDFRGYVPGKGWGHSIAHSADALAQLAQIRYLNADLKKKILMTIAQKTIEPPFLYAADEAERLSHPAAILVQQGELEKETLEEFFNILKDTKNQKKNHPDGLFRFLNARNLIRGMYFGLYKEPDSEEILAKLMITLTEMDAR